MLSGRLPEGQIPNPFCSVETTEHVALELPCIVSDMATIYFVNVQQTGGFMQWGREKEKVDRPLFYEALPITVPISSGKNKSTGLI